MTQPISFVVYLPGQPEKRDELFASLETVLDAMSHEPDFVNTYLHRAADDPDTLVLYETWACSAEYFVSHHLSKPYRADYERKLGDLLKSERRIEWLEPVKAYEPKATQIN
ncbi:MAG TPA: antibiotic biosynthesis monooxygenase [Pararobbsia sp.]|nr:antibiotic biosynthesis monooxygenase [Pararobbsia sp.]